MHFPKKSYYLGSKNINITGIPKNHSQIKYIGQLLTQIDKLKKTAVVLSDESLLPILLNSLTIPLSEVNITMGYPLKKTNIANFVISLFQLKGLCTENGWFHKDLINTLTNPAAPLFFEKKSYRFFYNSHKKQQPKLCFKITI